MKRFILLIVAILALKVFAINKTLIIYQGEDIQIFLYNQIDSIRYSCISLDSINVGNPVVQEIWTPDSVYRYPINEIDSITFQTPPTIPRANSINLAEYHQPYILRMDNNDGLRLYMSHSLPSSLSFEIGDYLYQAESTETLPNGFAAKVIDVIREHSGYRVECEPADLNEIFEQIVWVGETTVDATKDRTTYQLPTRSVNSVQTLAPYETTTRYPDYISGVIVMTDKLRDIPVGPEHAQIEGDVSLRSHITLNCGIFVLSSKRFPRINQRVMHVKANTDVWTSVSGRYIVEGKHKVSRNEPNILLPIGMGQTINMGMNSTMIVEGPMGIDYSFNASYSSNSTTIVEYADSGYVRIKTLASSRIIDQPKHNLNASMDGSVTLTGTLSFTLSPMADSLKTCTTSLSYGTSLIGSALFKKSEYEAAKTNNQLYIRLTSTGIIAQPIFKLSSLARYRDITLKDSSLLESPMSQTFYVVPKFTNPCYDINKKIMSYSIEGEPMTFSNVKLGYAIGKDISDLIVTESKFSWPTDCVDTYQFPVNFSPSSKEIIYPTVTMPTGEMILAAPNYPSNSRLSPYVATIYSNKVRFTMGAYTIGSSKNDTITIHIGNIFPSIKNNSNKR